MKKNRSIRTTFYTANQLIIVLLLIYASSHNAFSQPIENSISSYSYNNGDTFAPDINSPIKYRVVDNEKKEVEVIRGFSPSGQDGPRIMGAFSIPKEVEYGATWTIVGIGDATFIDENQMEAITLPETIKRIGKMAFKNCTRLYRIQIEGRADANKDFVFNLPPSLEEIGEQAFYECIAFGNIKIPDSVRLIGEQAFYRCINLSEIKIPDSVQLIGKQAFYNCTNLQYLTIGKSVEHILEKTFYFCPLSKITLNEGLKTIGSSAFCQRISPNNQGALTELIIPDSVTKIEADAFGCCSFLKNLVLGSSLNSIGDHAFFNSISLKTVTLRTPEPPTLGIYVFSVSKESTNFYVPECTRHKYLRQYPWKEYTIIDPFVLTDFVVEVEGEVVDDIFTKGLTMQEGEQKSIKATPVPYVKDLYLSWSNRYYGISGCWAMNLPCENTTTITAKESGTDYVEISCGAYNFSKIFVLTVLPPPEVKPSEQIELSHETLSLEKGESVTIMATVMPEDATDKTITWASSDEAVATVDAEGKVTAVALGEATITATCGEVSTYCTVTVVATPAESITISQETATLKVGETVELTATVMPEDATDKTVSWTSSDEAVATVDAEGKVTAVALGEATITATCGEVSTYCTVTVVATPAESITISQETATLKVGETVELTATVMPEDATDKTVSWTSSDEAVATVDAEGKVTAVALGEATVTAKCGEVSTYCTVTVVATPAESITISQETATLKVGKTVELTATVMPEDATDKTITWASSDEAVATVDAEGKVTAVALGEATITATCGEVSTYCTVTVVATPAESITISQETATLKVGETVELTATVMPEDATDKTVSWTSSDEAVATVDAEGKVTAVALGEAEITATAADGSGISANCLVTVNPVLAESLIISPESWNGVANESFRITAVVKPDNTTDKTLMWSTNDATIATVDDNGLVSVLKEGSCRITVATVDGSNLTAECIITGMSGIDCIFDVDDAKADVYNIKGMLLKRQCDKTELKLLAPGVYVVRNNKGTTTILIH